MPIRPVYRNRVLDAAVDKMKLHMEARSIELAHEELHTCSGVHPFRTASREAEERAIVECQHWSIPITTAVERIELLGHPDSVQKERVGVVKRNVVTGSINALQTCGSVRSHYLMAENLLPGPINGTGGQVSFRPAC